MVLVAFATGLHGCSPAGGGSYDVRAVVLEAGGPSDLSPDALLDAGGLVRTGSAGNLTLGLLPGTAAALGAGGELRLDRLRLHQKGSRTLGREADLTLTAGSLDLLITAPEEAAPTTVRLRTPAGEIVAGPGCLARIRLETAPAGTVRVLCARGELRCAGERVPAGAAGTFPAAMPPRSVVGDATGQTELITLLETGSKLQNSDLQRQAKPPGWRKAAP